jgi:hypothetical protein
MDEYPPLPHTMQEAIAADEYRKGGDGNTQDLYVHVMLSVARRLYEIKSSTARTSEP